ncbi:MAG TPA: transposase [Acidimicrobiia bacterium]|nr:transposase [Acidimicrobiia bacterium]
MGDVVNHPRGDESPLIGIPDQLLADICLRRLDHVAFPRVDLDALHVKRRKDGRAVYLSVVTATGQAADGEWEPLGIAVGDSEDASFWTSFLVSLRHRGLHGVEVVWSADHGGVDDAVAVVFPDARWQRAAGAPDPSQPRDQAEADKASNHVR